MLNLNGKRFGKLEVLRYAYIKERYTHWECKCDCGTIKIAKGAGLMKGDIKSCGCLRQNIHSKRPYEWLYTIMTRYLAKRRYHDFTENIMSYEEFITFTNIKNCHYCGEEVSWPKHRTYKEQQSTNTTKYNIDRKNNDLGYIKDNCVVCCTLCNYVKGKSLTYDEILIVGKSIAEVQKTRQSRLTDTNSTLPGVLT